MQNYHIFERYRNIFSIAIGDDVMHLASFAAQLPTKYLRDRVTRRQEMLQKI